MISTTRWTVAVLSVLGALWATMGEGVAADTEPQALAAVLTSDASYMEKLQACKRLGEIGGRGAVDALVPLLAEEPLSHAARIALEAIPDEAAGAALHTALAELEGLPRIGVIQSLGVRREAAAVADLRALLEDDDPATASAAATALGEIATTEAAEALGNILPDAPADVRAAIGDGLLAVAQIRADEGNTAEAAAWFDRVHGADLPTHLHLAAARGAIQSGAADALERFLELVRADEAAAFAMALEVGRLLPAAEVAPLVAAELSESPAHRQPLLVTLLGDLGDRAALPAVVEAVGSGDQAVRLAALSALGNLGDASTLPLLLELAAGEDEEGAGAARQSLGRLDDPGIDAQIARRLLDADEGMTESERLLLVDLAGRRRIEEAVSALLAAAEAPQPAVRLAAIAALGETLAPPQLDALTERLLNPRTPEELAAVQAALRAASIRTADREGAAEQLAACLADASAEMREFLIDLLGAVGGETALTAVARAALDPDLQDTATRVLGEWMTPDAAPALLAVVRQSPEQRFRIRALRGYLRIVRQFDVPDDERVAMCRRALELAERHEERVLALEALGRVPTRAALELARAHLAEEGLAEPAAAAAVAVGEQIVAVHPQTVAEAMAAVLRTTDHPELTARATHLARQADP